MNKLIYIFLSVFTLLLALACTRTEDALPPPAGTQQEAWRVDSVGTIHYALCANTQLVYTAPQEADVQSRLWLPGGASGEQFTVADTGLYTLTTTFASGRVRVDTFIVYAQKGAIAFPTAFAPNGNGPNNHAFAPNGSCIAHVVLTVYGLDGGVSQVVELGGTQVAWDGTDGRGRKLPAGPYGYRYTVRFRNGATGVGEGVVQLIR